MSRQSQDQTSADQSPSSAPDERPKSRNVKALRGILPFLRPYRWVVAGALVALTVAAGATLAIGQAVRRMVDNGFSQSQAAFLDQYFLALFGVIVVLAFATFGRFYLVTWLGERVVADIRRAVYNHVLNLNPEFFELTRTGEVLSRLTTDTTLIQSVIGSSASVALRNVLLFLGGMVLLVLTAPKLAGLILLFVPLVVVPLADTEATGAIAVSRQARRLGIRRGMMLAEIRRVCPDVAVRVARHDVYVRWHHRLLDEIARHAPIDMVHSIDELSIRLDRRQRRPERARALGRAIKEGIAARVGVAPVDGRGFADRHRRSAAGGAARHFGAHEPPAGRRRGARCGGPVAAGPEAGARHLGIGHWRAVHPRPAWRGR